MPESQIAGTTPTFISYAQNAEDVVLWRALGHIDNGRYIDVGACDPVEYSVTKAFYDRGWSGINVEPVEYYAQRLRDARPNDVTVQAAAGEASGVATLHMARHTGLSSLQDDRIEQMQSRGFAVEDVEVDVRTLNEIIATTELADSEIHFLKIDVEGAEGQVIAGLDLTRHRPWIIIVESTALLSSVESDHAWRPSIIAHGYTHALFDGLNSIYVANERSELLRQLSYGAGVHDQPFIASQLPAVRDFIEQHQHLATEKSASEIDRLLRHIEEVQSIITRLEDEYAHLEAHVRHRESELHLERLAHASTQADLAAAELQQRAWRHEITNLQGVLARLEFDRSQILQTNHENHIERVRLQKAVDEFESTVSWRITSPLRAARRARQRAVSVAKSVKPDHVATRAGTDAMPPRDSPLYAAAIRRLRQVGALIGAQELSAGADPYDELAARLAKTSLTPDQAAWLVLVALGNSYPNDLELSRAARALRVDGPGALFERARHFFADCTRLGRTTELDLEIVDGGVLVDVSHTAAHSLHTGIQRVVRESVSRWLANHEDLILVHWDFRTNSPRKLASSEVSRFSQWRHHLDASHSEQPRDIEDASDRVVVPWHSTYVIPELAAEPDRCNAYRSMKSTGICELAMIVYDMIPFTASETVANGMPELFSHAMSVAKAADRLSAISSATANEYAAFVLMLAQQGLDGPLVVAHPLPAARVNVSAEDLASTRRDLRLGSAPIVLVVGSHEPRKNHVTVLEAADALWREGHRFQVVFVGGSGWKSDEFDEYADRLMKQNRDVQVLRKATELQVWSLYRLAHFTAFPSLVEGYGLPISESLVSGTPVITSAHGSMAEVAQGGGALMVNPRDPADLAAAMRTLLTDSDVRERLAAEALERQWPSWSDYADELWAFFTSSGSTPPES